MADGREEGRKERALSMRELTDITESLRWKAGQDEEEAKRLRGVDGVVEERWLSLYRTLIEQAQREQELAERLEQEGATLILRESISETGVDA